MNIEKVHVGKIVEEVFNKQKNITKAAFARAIGVQPQNIDKRFKAADWSIIKLIRAGQFLKYDFRYLFDIPDKEDKMEEPEFILQIKIHPDKVNDVLKAVDNMHLYEILKQ